MSDGSSKPGEIIKPELCLEEANAISCREWELQIADIKELISYDDRNYLIKTETGTKYIFKVLNSLASQSPLHASAQNQMMLYLSSKGINCPEPIKDKRGEFVTEIRLKGRDGQEKVHLGRLLTYLDGEVLHTVPFTPHLLYQVGELTAKMSTALSDFHHEAIMSYDKIWRLDAVPRVKEFTYAVTDPSRRELVTTVINEFEKIVIPEIDGLEKSAVHGDLNDLNLLVQPSGQNYKLSGVIDFGDIHFSCALFELAISMAYMILDCTMPNPLDAGGYVLAGYLKHRKLTEKDWSLLKICIAARYAQSLSLGAYSFLLDGDEYTLSTSKRGWTVLGKLWEIPEKELLNSWKEIVKTCS